MRLPGNCVSQILEVVCRHRIGGVEIRVRPCAQRIVDRQGITCLIHHGSKITVMLRKRRNQCADRNVR